MKKVNLWFIISLVLFVGLIISLIVGDFGGQSFSPEEMADKSVDFINKAGLAGGEEAFVVPGSAEYIEEDEVYKFALNMGGQEYISYTSKEGNFLFPTGLDVKEINEMLEQYNQSLAEQSAEIPKSEIPDVKLFVMSYCPYGNQAENAMIPVAQLLKDKVNIELKNVIYSDYATRMGGEAKDWCLDEEEKYCSMHGINELNQDIRELCVAKYEPDKLWDFVKEINEKTTVDDVEEKWEGIAQELGLDTDRIKKCQNEEGEDLLAEQVALNEEYGISGSPTLLINGVEYSGARTPEDYKIAICNAFVEPPEECQIELENTDTSSNQGGC